MNNTTIIIRIHFAVTLFQQYSLGEEVYYVRSILVISKNPIEKRHGVAHPQQAHDCKAHCGDVTITITWFSNVKSNGELSRL
jgi:hypothetical protein